MFLVRNWTSAIFILGQYSIRRLQESIMHLIIQAPSQVQESRTLASYSVSKTILLCSGRQILYQGQGTRTVGKERTGS